MFCSNCGNKIQDDAHYCSVCGHRVVDDTGEDIKENSPDQDPSETKDTGDAGAADIIPPVVPPNIPTYPPNANVPPVVPKGKKWSKIWVAAAVLLVLVLGGIVAAWLLG